MIIIKKRRLRKTDIKQKHLCTYRTHLFGKESNIDNDEKRDRYVDQCEGECKIKCSHLLMYENEPLFSKCWKQENCLSTSCKDERREVLYAKVIENTTKPRIILSVCREEADKCVG